MLYLDIPYGEHQRHRLDLSLPDGRTGTLGLILYIHGGAWIGGDKDCYRGELERRNAQGYAAASINYRYVSREVDLDGEADDIAAAAVKIKSFAAEKGVNLEKALLTGHSAGGHLSLFYAYSRARGSAIEPAAVAAFCGPVDLSTRDFYEKGVQGHTPELCDLFTSCTGRQITTENFFAPEMQKRLREVSPVDFISPATPPTVIAHGEIDDIVPFSQAAELDSLLSRCGVTHELVSYPHSGHELGRDPDAAARAEELLCEYAGKYLS
ncbi:MAG: alpha/beta hydrolase [Clostridia bacterium]|nr:alpha/beta hydrolase [Clostridia bacterium]